MPMLRRANTDSNGSTGSPYRRGTIVDVRLRVTDRADAPYYEAVIKYPQGPTPEESRSDNIVPVSWLRTLCGRTFAHLKPNSRRCGTALEVKRLLVNHKVSINEPGTLAERSSNNENNPYNSVAYIVYGFSASDQLGRAGGSGNVVTAAPASRGITRARTA